MRRAVLAFVMVGLWGSSLNVRAVSPETVLVLVNRRSAGDLEIANYYREKRQIPARNFFYLDTDLPKWTISEADFQSKIFAPALAYIEQQGLKHVDVWVTTPSFPIRVDTNSLSSAIFFRRSQKISQNKGLGPGGYDLVNPYQDTMLAFEKTGEGALGFLHMALNAGSVESTKKMIDRSVYATGRTAEGVIYLMDGVGPRSSRKVSIPSALRMLEVLGRPAVGIADGEILDKQAVVGAYCGNIGFPVDRNKFVPGSLGDLLTSRSGCLDNTEGQTPCTEFLRVGCSGTYGTVVEPYNYPEKFPTAKLYVYYALGFSAVESYWMSVVWPQEGLFMGDPLTRPFATLPKVEFVNLQEDQELKGTVEISAKATLKGEGVIGVSRAALFCDGRLISKFPTVTPAEDTKVAIDVGSGRVMIDATTEDTLPILTQRIAETLNEKTIFQVRPTPGEILMLAPAGNVKNLIPKAGASSATVTCQFAARNIAVGRPVPVETNWFLTGQSLANDLFTLEIKERDKIIKTVTYLSPSKGDAVIFAEQFVKVVNRQLPEGYSLTVKRRPDRTDFAAIFMSAEPATVLRRPVAQLTVETVTGSTIRLAPDSVFVPLKDPSLEGYDLTWLHVGIGEPILEVKANLPTEQLSDGRHVLRVVAYQGSASKPSGFAETSVIVRNREPRLILRESKTSVKLASGLIEVGRCETKGINPNEIEIRVNEQRTGTASGSARILLIDPMKLGVGDHTVSVRAKVQGRQYLVSDNVIKFSITP